MVSFPISFWTYKIGSSTSYDQGGSEPTIDIPVGCTHTRFKMWGAGGQQGDYAATGGGGAYCKSTPQVASYNILQLIVGADDGNPDGSGSGGGASGVKIGTTTLCVAGAGGGGANQGGIGDATPAGAGGGLTGEDGLDGNFCTGGGGGTQSAGGAHGTDVHPDDPCSDGEHGPGGRGNLPQQSNYYGWIFAGTGGGINGAGGISGAGGGGWYGGGGGGTWLDEGDSCGGGGGSSYDPTGLGTLTGGAGPTPGNQADPDRAGAGQGGDSGNSLTATPGIIKVTYLP